MKKRIIIPNAKSLKQTYQYFEEASFWAFLAFVGALNIKDLIPFLKISSKTRNYFTGLTFLVLIICLIGLYFSNKVREVVPVLKVDKMNAKSKFIAWRIRRCFSIVALTDVLGFDNKTRYGFAMPEIFVFVNQTCSGGWIAIENMKNYQKLSQDSTLHDLSSLLVGRLIQKYSFTNSELSKDGNFIIFYFEDAVESHRLVVKNNNVKPFISNDNNEVKLAKDLVWHSSVSPHLAIIGRTRSGKSMLCGSYLVPLLIAQNWKIAFYSTKNDKYVRAFKGEYEPERIISSLENWAKIMKKRADLIAKAGKDSYLDMPNMRHIGIFIDEVGNLNAQVDEDKALKMRWKNVIKALTSAGASSGISIIACSQYGSLEGFLPSSLAVTNLQDAVIILGLAADSPKDRQYFMAGFELEHRNYKAGQGVARFTYSGQKWEKPCFYETPLIC